MTPEDLLSIEDLTQVLNVPRDAVNSWMKQGVLKPVRMGVTPQFRFEDVRAFVRKQMKSAQHDTRVLVIDDDLLVGNSMVRLLEKSGIHAVTIPLGLAALDLLSNESFDLILADIRMPGMNGLETLKAIREMRNQFGKPSIPEMIITAYDDEEIRQEAERMGITDFILKPFEPSELIARLKQHLARTESIK